MISSFHLLLLIFLFGSIRGQITPHSGVLVSTVGPTGLRLGEVKDNGNIFEILVLNGVAATWGQWDSWSTCTGSCDIGIQQRRRECREIVVIGQVPDSDIGTGAGCFGYNSQDKGCALRPCVGTILPWGPWSNCSGEVGSGGQFRTRICVGPGECVQETFDFRGCKSVSRYSWTEWTAYTPCLVSCGRGLSFRSRRCAAPDGSHAADISECSDPLNLGSVQARECRIRCCHHEMLECDDGQTCIEHFKFCNGDKDCSDGWDEQYAMDENNNNLTLCRGIGFWSEPLCILPLELEKDRNQLCAEETPCSGEEFECRNPTSKCIPAQYFCDGEKHCSDGSDEITSSPAANSGYRACLGRQGSDKLRQTCQLSEEYFCDGEPICAEGTDECLCGERHKDHIDNVCFRCFGNSATHIPIKMVCDGKFDCPDRTDECLCLSTIRPDICERLEWKKEKPYLLCKGSNNSIWVDVIAGQVCDIKSQRRVDEKMRLCEYSPLLLTRGCSGSQRGNRACYYMIETRTQLDTCPRNTVNCMTFLDHNQFPEIYSNSSEPWITCNVEFNSSTNRILYDCTNVHYQKISTNKECKNQGINVNGGYFTTTCNCSYFKCDDDIGEMYIDGKAVCDGLEDCRSGIDECQPGCIDSAFSDEKFMIRNKGVMALVWIFSIIAIIGCASVVASTLHGIVQSSRRDGNNAISSHSNINKLLIMSLSISDLLVVIYTMSICIKAVEVDGRYCEVDVEWRTGTTCSILGALLIIGSEQSVFTMVMITIFRLNAVMRPLARPKLNRAIMGVAISWFTSILIGSIPLIHYLEDYFLTDVAFNDTVLFKTKVNQNDKQHLIKWLSFLNNGSGVEHGDSTEWGQLRKLISQINIYSPIKSTYEFGYYSSHTVCLPTFFPDRNKDGSWGYSFALMVLNIGAFVFMLVCYIALYRKATNRKIVKSSTARNKRDEQSAAMQRKLTRILASDFLCWVPVCIMGFLQVAGIDIPPDAYLPTGLFILPINSAVNPFLYSDLPDLILSQGRRSFTWVTESFRRWRKRGTSPETPPAEVQALQLNVLEVQDETSQRSTELTC